MTMVRDLQDNLWVSQTIEMTETTRGCLTHPLLLTGAMTIKTGLEEGMTVEVATTEDRGTMVVEDMMAVEVDETTASVVEITIVTKEEMIANTTVSTAMVEGQEVRGMTIEGDLTQL